MKVGWERSRDLCFYLTFCWALRFFCVGSRLSLSASECFGGFGVSAGLWVVSWVSGSLVALWAVWRLWGLGWALGSRLGFGLLVGRRAVCWLWGLGWALGSRLGFGAIGRVLGSLVALGLRLGFGQSVGPWVHWPGFGASAGLWVVGWVLGDIRPCGLSVVVGFLMCVMIVIELRGVEWVLYIFPF